jgi:hypothetical protein
LVVFEFYHGGVSFHRILPSGAGNEQAVLEEASLIRFSAETTSLVW